MFKSVMFSGVLGKRRSKGQDPSLMGVQGRGSGHGLVIIMAKMWQVLIVLGSVSYVLPVLTHLTHRTALLGRHCIIPILYFDEEIEAQRGSVICLTPHS